MNNRHRSIGRIALFALLAAALWLTSYPPASVLGAPEATPGTGVTVGTPVITATTDGCQPGVRDPGDTILISSLLSNNSGTNQPFRAVFRITGSTGGTSSNLNVGLLYGGPSHMSRSGNGGAYWDDSFGEVVNTPTVASVGSYTVVSHFSISRKNLTNALNIPQGGTGAPTIAVHLYNADFTVYYGSASTPLGGDQPPRY